MLREDLLWFYLLNSWEEKRRVNKREEDVQEIKKKKKRRKWSHVCCAREAFILGFTVGIPDGSLNIIILNV
jgi:hypothetical protein